MDIESLLASLPTPTPEYMQARRAFARQYTLVFLRRGPAPRDDEVRNERLQLEHLQHLARLQMLGKLVLNGTTSWSMRSWGSACTVLGSKKPASWPKRTPR
jgi:hypothetical protein